MHRLTEAKIILVTRPTRVAELRRRFSTKMQAAFYVSRLGQDFSDYENEDGLYTAAVRTAVETLDTLGRVQPVDRSFLPNFVFGPEDVVVVLGQDGLVANTMKYLNGQPVIGVNPEPARWDGQLLPFRVMDLGKVVLEVIQRRRSAKPVTMAQARLNTGETLYAVNDLFVGPRSHTSARYLIEIGGEREAQSSSGVIISTGLGSTGWLKSLLTGASVIVQSQGTAKGKSRPPPVKSEFAWDSNYLCFTVREPFPTRATGTRLVFGRVTSKSPLVIESQMPEHGVIFSDGIESDFLAFRSGVRATISPADRQGWLVT
ncbi:MAG: sugar kinase [Verrucomicrobia bacterium]|nr:sugar kinase [Verrucomicrobiota bacterium]